MKAKKIVTIILIILLMIILTIIYNKIIFKPLEQPQNNILEQVFEDKEKDNKAYLTLYTIYGNHLNIKGYIDLDDITISKFKDLKLVFQDENKNELVYNLNYTVEGNRYSFKLSDKNNGGINLEKLDINKYFIFLKVIENEGEIEKYKYYSIENTSEYKDDVYYSMTSNFTNKKISFNFREYAYDENINLDYFQIKVDSEKLPIDVYDIVIDAGHGGKDPGAMYGGKEESDFTLDYSIALKQRLESLGYKVKLTRERDEYIESYGPNARATTGYETKAKLVLSIHLNSTLIKNPLGGVEVYAANNLNLDFAKAFADNIVTYTAGRYSPNNIAKVLEGVYVRTYTQEEVDDAIEYAHDLNYTPYENLSTQTPYLFMLRETGGIMTGAYIDGRNTTLKDNPYRNNNITPETYLLELGFINCENDMNNLIKNKDKYIDAIVDTIVNHYK